YSAAEGAEAVVIVTEWDALRALDLPRLKGIMNGVGLVDLRNIYRPEVAEAAGFTYVSVGRGTTPEFEELVQAAE
ncbi:UDP binding domain-containing protein, partial [Sphingobium sp. LB126]